MANNKTTFKKKHRRTHQKKDCSNKNHRKYVKKNSVINRVQIGCSNSRNKVMMGGGVNAISQPFENIGYNIFDGITNAYNSLFGYSMQPSSDVAYQPYLL
jgi:hypothetical protein